MADPNGLEGINRTSKVSYQRDSSMPAWVISGRTCANGHVRFAPESRHVHRNSSCLLWAKSGHAATRMHSQSQWYEVKGAWTQVQLRRATLRSESRRISGGEDAFHCRTVCFH